MNWRRRPRAVFDTIPVIFRAFHLSLKATLTYWAEGLGAS